MSISKKWVSDPNNRDSVLSMYRSSDLYTLEAIAEKLGTTYHNVSHVVNRYMEPAEKKALACLRYSLSKAGTKNPMKGKTGENHHNWKGLCDDGYGYLTCLYKGKRTFVHQAVLMEALGLSKWPAGFEVHHIDEDKKNNALDNLALVTPHGHRTIHFLQVKDSASLALKRSSLAESMKYLTSQ